MNQGLYQAAFTYTDDVLADFEALYQQKREISVPMRIALGALGAAGAVYCGYLLYRDGLQFTLVGYLVICSILLVVALSGGGKRPDGTVEKYRKHYLDRKATIKIDDEGVELKLEGQKNYARSKFREIYGLFDTDRCLYFVIKGKAYYILPRDSVDGDVGQLMKYLQKKCGKRFQHYEIDKP